MTLILALDDESEGHSLYAQLRALARAMPRSQRPPSVDATDLANEAYVRVAATFRGRRMNADERRRYCATVVKHIAVDEARRHRPRPVGCTEILASVADRSSLEPTGRALEADAALELLRMIDPRQARVIELIEIEAYRREEVAAELGIAVRTVARELRLARAWLHQRLTSPAGAGSY